MAFHAPLMLTRQRRHRWFIAVPRRRTAAAPRSTAFIVRRRALARGYLVHLARVSRRQPVAWGAALQLVMQARAGIVPLRALRVPAEVHGSAAPRRCRRIAWRRTPTCRRAACRSGPPQTVPAVGDERQRQAAGPFDTVESLSLYRIDAAIHPKPAGNGRKVRCAGDAKMDRGDYFGWRFVSGGASKRLLRFSPVPLLSISTAQIVPKPTQRLTGVPVR